MLDFFKILNMGFCCTIIGKFHAKKEKDPPYNIRPAHTVTHTRTHKRTIAGGQKTKINKKQKQNRNQYSIISNYYGSKIGTHYTISNILK